LSNTTTPDKSSRPRIVRAGEDSPQLTDQMIDDTRKLIGVWLRRDVHVKNIYEPLSIQDIRRWAMYSVGDDNPLWQDIGYAKMTAWGNVIAPPTFLLSVDSAIIAPGLPGIQWIGAGGRWEHFKAVRAGDTITSRGRMIDVQIREGKNVPRYINQVGEVLYYNQNGDVVARYEGDTFRIPRKNSGGGFKFAVKDKTEVPKPYVYTNDEIDEIAHAYRTEERRGANPRYWEDCKVGDSLPVLYKGPLTLVDVVGFYAGRRNVYNVLKLAFAERDRHPNNVYYSRAMNVPMHPAAGHFDVEIAHEIGMPGAYDHAWQRPNWGAHLLTNWAGDLGFIRKFTGRVLKPNVVGDLTKITGTIKGLRKDNGEALVDIDWWGTNQRGEKNCDGTGTVRLPSRDPSLSC